MVYNEYMSAMYHDYRKYMYENYERRGIVTNITFEDWKVMNKK